MADTDPDLTEASGLIAAPVPDEQAAPPE